MLHKIHWLSHWLDQHVLNLVYFIQKTIGFAFLSSVLTVIEKNLICAACQNFLSLCCCLGTKLQKFKGLARSVQFRVSA